MPQPLRERRELLSPPPGTAVQRPPPAFRLDDRASVAPSGRHSLPPQDRFRGPCARRNDQAGAVTASGGFTGDRQAGSGRRPSNQAEVVAVRPVAGTCPMSSPKSAAPQALAEEGSPGPDSAPVRPGGVRRSSDVRVSTPHSGGGAFRKSAHVRLAGAGRRPGPAASRPACGRPPARPSKASGYSRTSASGLPAASAFIHSRHSSHERYPPQAFVSRRSTIGNVEWT